MTAAPTTEPSLKPFYTIWTGQALSLLGSQVVQFALIWWLTETTRSATVLAAATLTALGPQVVLGPFIGALVDRWNRRRVMILADSLVAAGALILAYLFWRDQAEVWHLFLLIFARGVGGAFHQPAMQASTTLMVPERHLTRVQGFNQALAGGLNIVSAPLGALALAALPLAPIVLLDALTAALAIIPLLFIAVPEPERGAAPGSVWGEMGAGLSYVRGQRGLMRLMALAALLNFLLVPAGSLMPLLVTNHFRLGALQLGWLQATIGVGTLAGGVLLGVWGGFRRRMVTGALGLIGLGLGALLMGLVPSAAFNLAVLAAFILGVSVPLANGPFMALFQVIVPPDMQGRVMSLLVSASIGVAPLGLALAGPLADWLGVQVWYAAGGAAAAAAGVYALASPLLRNIDAGLDEGTGRSGGPVGEEDGLIEAAVEAPRPGEAGGGE